MEVGRLAGTDFSCPIIVCVEIAVYTFYMRFTVLLTILIVLFSEWEITSSDKNWG